MDTRKSAMKYIGKDSFFEFFIYREKKGMHILQGLQSPKGKRSKD
jgi:hypothetical protein